MRIGLTYDLQTNPHDERQAEFDSPATIGALVDALCHLGHEVLALGNAHALLADRSWPRRIDLAFNIAEGDRGRTREAWVPMLLELAGVPYVGSDPLALSLALDKVMMKRLAVAEGVPTPAWMCVAGSSELPAQLPIAYPLIVKPRFQGSGQGIEAASVVRDREALAAQVDSVTRRFNQPVVVEELIADGELTVLLIGNDPVFAYPVVQRPIDPETRLAMHVLRPAPERWICPLTLDPALEAEAVQHAKTMFHAIGCRDMARIDCRVNASGRVQFLEINPLPSFDPHGTIGLLAEHAGMPYGRLVGSVLDAAIERVRMPDPQPA
jgi:D-alanine-D-alanine ligase